jgi:hypothetical protein
MVEVEGYKDTDISAASGTNSPSGLAPSKLRHQKFAHVAWQISPTSTSRISAEPSNRITTTTLDYPPHDTYITADMAAVQSVQCFGKKKTATAVAHCKQGKGLIKVNGKPLSLVEPQVLRFKVYEPVLILGLDKFGE